ncbi:hypothetical protein ACU4GD_10830 [Cupriavidus basilensis]
MGAVTWPYYLKRRDKPLRISSPTPSRCARPWRRRLAGAELVADVEATGNYSYGDRADLWPELRAAWRAPMPLSTRCSHRA